MAFEYTPDVLRQQMYQEPNYTKVDNREQGFFKWFLDSKEDIENLKNYWRGYERDPKGVWRQTIFSEARRLMNEEGIHWSCQIVETYLSKNLQATSWDEDHMNYEMRKAYRTIWYGLITQWKQFNMKKINVQVVANGMLAMIHSMMLAARGEGIRRLLKETQNVSEIRQMNPNERSGIFSGLTSIFRRGNRGNIGGQGG